MTVGLSASALLTLMKWTPTTFKSTQILIRTYAFVLFTHLILDSIDEHQIDWSVLQRTSRSRETGVSYSYNDTTCE